MRHGSEGARAPYDPWLLYGEAPSNRDRRRAAIGIMQLVFGDKVSQVVAGRRAIPGSAALVVAQISRQFRPPVFDDMGEDQVAGLQIRGIDAYFAVIQQNRIRLTDLAYAERNAAIALRAIGKFLAQRKPFVQRRAVTVESVFKRNGCEQIRGWGSHRRPPYLIVAS